MRQRFPIWASLFGYMIAAAFIFGIANWIYTLYTEPIPVVTNREFSVFLWHNPGYAERVVNPALAEQQANVSKHSMRAYRKWTRERVVPDRPIPGGDFIEFLSDVPEWQPRYWREAPLHYGELIEEAAQDPKMDLSPLLPDDVRLAFYGWQASGAGWDNRTIEARRSETDVLLLSDCPTRHH